MSDFKFNCPHCNQSLEASDDLIGKTVVCPACNQLIELLFPEEVAPVKVAPVKVAPVKVAPEKFMPEKFLMEEQATEGQLSCIRRFGKTPEEGLTKKAATALISYLIKTVPPTDRQLKRLARYGVTASEKLTKFQADKLIEELRVKTAKLKEELENAGPPELWQVEEITLLGGIVPKTRGEAMSAVLKLRETAPATELQRRQIQQLGGDFPEGCVYNTAEAVIEGLHQDADPEDGKPPTKPQITKIIKLGGDPSKAINTWRAGAYIEALEARNDEFITRVEDALSYYYDDMFPEDNSGKKPSKAVMGKALRFGDSKGWGEYWEKSSSDNVFSLMAFAIYSINPELFDPGGIPPRMPT